MEHFQEDFLYVQRQEHIMWKALYKSGIIIIIIIITITIICVLSHLGILI